jgi:predicted DNA binding CopG/RHH family protein
LANSIALAGSILMINSPAPSFSAKEQQILSDFNAGELRSVAMPDLLNQLQQSATATGANDQRINIRLSSADLRALNGAWWYRGSGRVNVGVVSMMQCGLQPHHESCRPWSPASLRRRYAKLQVLYPSPGY